eukprot:914612-Prymnesium_polylepis.1
MPADSAPPPARRYFGCDVRAFVCCELSKRTVAGGLRLRSRPSGFTVTVARFRVAVGRRQCASHGARDRRSMRYMGDGLHQAVPRALECSMPLFGSCLVSMR